MLVPGRFVPKCRAWGAAEHIYIYIYYYIQIYGICIYIVSQDVSGHHVGSGNTHHKATWLPCKIVLSTWINRRMSGSLAESEGETPPKVKVNDPRSRISPREIAGLSISRAYENPLVSLNFRPAN